MHIYQFSINKPASNLFNSNDWIKACYRYFTKSTIDELFIIRHNALIDLFAVGSNSKTIGKSINEYLSKKIDNNIQISESPRENHNSLIYLFEMIVGKEEGLPSDPKILLQMREEFNLALNAGAVGSILTKMYRQAENIGNMLQIDPIIKKNCIAKPDVILDIAEKIAGKLAGFQFICMGAQNTEMREIVNSINKIGDQKKYIYHDDFSKSYQAGIDLGCIPLNKDQLENQIDDNTIFIYFGNSSTKKINWIIPAAKRNKNYLYIYFDLSNNKRSIQTSYPNNLYVQSQDQISGLIDKHIKIRREHLRTVDSLFETEMKSFYSWLYSDERFIFNDIVSADRRMQKVFELMRRIAPSDISVLISGETGTGKELIAKAIHQNSKRSNGRFVAVNCSAIPDTLLEGELFGYEKGAFTGAVSAKKGLIEIASGGTLFLDEIGDLPPMIQVKLLRVLQEREIMHIGSTTPISVDIRLVTATNQNLDILAENNRFRSDLYYRVNTVQINLPALRERREDIPLLTDYFLKRLTRNSGKQINKISDDVYKRFVSYDWPGNIRELENIIERAFAVSIGEEITVTDLPTRLQSYPIRSHLRVDESEYYNGSLKELESERIKDLIVNRKMGLTETAQMLGIGRTTLWRKMRKFGISKDSIEGNIES
jgi:transcriptional regulator with PAS, ATPase and Fis domain